MGRSSKKNQALNPSTRKYRAMSQRRMTTAPPPLQQHQRTNEAKTYHNDDQEQQMQKDIMNLQESIRIHEQQQQQQQLLDHHKKNTTRTTNSSTTTKQQEELDTTTVAVAKPPNHRMKRKISSSSSLVVAGEEHFDSSSTPNKKERNDEMIATCSSSTHPQQNGSTTLRIECQKDHVGIENEFGNDDDDDAMYTVSSTMESFTYSTSIRKKKKQKNQQETSLLLDTTTTTTTAATVSASLLTPYEIKLAKKEHVKNKRKLIQLQKKIIQKQKRTELYTQLAQMALPVHHVPLLESSSTLSRPNNNNNTHSSSSKIIMIQSSTETATAASSTCTTTATNSASSLNHSTLQQQQQHHQQNVQPNNKTKRQILQKALYKEQIGVPLQPYEEQLLYQRRGGNDDDGDDTRVHNSSSLGPMIPSRPMDPDITENEASTKPVVATQRVTQKENQKIATNQEHDTVSTKQYEIVHDMMKDKYCKTITSEVQEDIHEMPYKDDDHDGNNIESYQGQGSSVQSETGAVASNSNSQECSLVKKTQLEQSPSSFAAEMMASLFKLQTKPQLSKQTEADAPSSDKEYDIDQKNNPTPATKKKRYIPEETVILKTPAAMGMKPQPHVKVAGQKLRPVDRPKDLQVARYTLPIAEMEFEVMDAIRDNDITIICAETGSGKSTQIPQFLYEAGFSQSQWKGGDVGSMGLIGITQPRRVAAITTAKRVCYEMGQGDGQSIRSMNNNSGMTGNVVSYQTRYETAGLGSCTHIKFMTDGILLQEIQSDLLLRKYNVIVLDEAHERNLNTDVLIGLLSTALPLRKQAVGEESEGVNRESHQQDNVSDTIKSDQYSRPKLLPLKLVIMSATLRVEDFTSNKLLFSSSLLKPPTVVTIPGRLHPVTIHHSKVTELESYEDIAFQKTCKIHRKLPQGGVLLFLTGKQEILRMVKRLRHALCSTGRNNSTCSVVNDEILPDSYEEGALRDMDDDELDADVFQDDDKNDDENLVPIAWDDALESTDSVTHLQAIVLPLYSMLSPEEQAKVFAPIPDNHRLIVVATNVAETSITIPGISYVVDPGRHKSKNFNPTTGIASYDIMWISKAAADQRAGRAGRTGPGHCYRLYSSTMYSRHFDAFALPEILTRPLEDVVLSMKAMKIPKVVNFPFPTPPDMNQLSSATDILAGLGCIDVSRIDESGGDGDVTPLGIAVSKLPLSVRFGKMLLLAAETGVLDYAIVAVAALSEPTPFLNGRQGDAGTESSDHDSDHEMDPTPTGTVEKKPLHKWMHKGGDVTAVMLAVGAYTYAGRSAGGSSEKLACRRFCNENGLDFVVMQRIQKMRLHLARLAKARLSHAQAIAARTGGILSSLPPPTLSQEHLLRQAIVAGFLDHIALLAPAGSVPGSHPFSLRSAYISASSTMKEPLFLDPNSVVFSRDTRLLPKWICFESVLRRKRKDGVPFALMKRITPVESSWLGKLAFGSTLLRLGEPLLNPTPIYDAKRDVVLCSVKTSFGSNNWELPPVTIEMYNALQTQRGKHCADDSFRWFGRFLLEGVILPELKGLDLMLNDNPAIITRHVPTTKVALLVSELSRAGIDSAAALQKHWTEKDRQFLFSQVKGWVRPEHAVDARALWTHAVKSNVQKWTCRNSIKPKQS